MSEEEAVMKSSMMRLFMEALFAWTPPAGLSINKFKSSDARLCRLEWMKNFIAALFFCVFFIVDLADAIIDLILGMKKFFQRDGEEYEKNYGILLFLMTILARIVAGLYGVATPHMKDDRAKMDSFFCMEIAVLMIEDGAALLLLLASDRNEDDVFTTLSAWLTAFCTICCIFYLLHWVYTFLCKARMEMGCIITTALSPLYITYFALIFFYPIVMMYVLFQEILLKDADSTNDSFFSDGRGIMSIIFFGFGAATMGGLSITISLKTISRRDEVSYDTMELQTDSTKA